MAEYENYYCYEGDYFGGEIPEDFITINCSGWKLWGQWIYHKQKGLIGLLTRPYGTKKWTGNYAFKNGYEEEVTRFKEKQ